MLTELGDSPFDMVKTAGLRLNGVKATTRRDGTPILKVGGNYMAGMAAHASAEPDTLVVRIGMEERRSFLEEAPETYYLTDYYRKHPVVPVRLARISAGMLRELLAMSRRATLAKVRVL